MRKPIRCPACGKILCTEHPTTRVTVLSLLSFDLRSPDLRGSITVCPRSRCSQPLEIRRSDTAAP